MYLQKIAFNCNETSPPEYIWKFTTPYNLPNFFNYSLLNLLKNHILLFPVEILLFTQCSLQCLFVYLLNQQKDLKMWIFSRHSICSFIFIIRGLDNINTITIIAQIIFLHDSFLWRQMGMMLWNNLVYI